MVSLWANRAASIKSGADFGRLVTLIEVIKRAAVGLLGVLRSRIERASHSERPTFEYMRINHRRFNILVAEEILHRTDIHAVLEQVGGEGVA